MTTTKRQRAPKNYEVGRTTTARFAGICAQTRRAFPSNAPLVYTARGWSINDEQTREATTTTTTTTTPTEAPTRAAFRAARSHFFADTNEFLEFANAAPARAGDSVKDDACRGRSASWYGGAATFADAIETARTGWAAGTDAIRDAREKLPALQTPDETRAEWFYDVSGDVLDVGRALSGEPEAFMCHEAAPGEGKILKICASVSHNWTVSSAEITRRGAQIAALIEALEIQGYSVQASVFSAFKIRAQAVFKKAGETLELDKAAFFLTHAATLRRLFFAIEEAHGTDLTRVGADHDARPDDPETIFINSRDDVLTVFRQRGLIA